MINKKFPWLVFIISLYLSSSPLAREPLYFSLKREKSVLTLTQSSSFTQRPSQLSPSQNSLKTFSFQDINEVLKEDSSSDYSSLISLTGPGVVIFQSLQSYIFNGLLESAGNALYIAPDTTVISKKGLRLGLTTEGIFYEAPLPLSRTQNTFPTFLRIGGTLRLDPIEKETILEFNKCGIVLEEQGSLQVGKKKIETTIGWQSSKGHITLYS